MSEPDAMRWPKDPDGLSKDSADADHADSENVLESTSDGNREDSGTDILRNDESLTAQGETITPRAEVETHTFLEPIEANGDVEIESFTIDEDDSGLELPEDELLDLTPSADARVISCVESDTSHKVDAELSSISDEKVGVSSEPSADADEESRHVAADDQHTEQASSVEEKVEVTQPLATGDTEEPAVLMVRVPGDERWFPLSEVIVQTTGEVLGEAAARWISRLYRQSLESPGEVPETSSAASGAEAEFAFPRIETVAEPTDYRERLKKAGPKKSFVKELLGIVLGGIGGLLIAYYALNWFGGPRYDFAKIPLPGIQHTYRHTPSWLRDLLEGKYWTSAGENPTETSPQEQ